MRQCQICGKSYVNKTTYRKVRSEWNPVNHKRSMANLQITKLADGTKTQACVRCIRTLNKPPKAKNPKKRFTPAQKKANLEKKVIKKAEILKRATLPKKRTTTKKKVVIKATKPKK